MIRTALAVAVLAFGATALVAQSDPIAARKALMKANGDQNRVATEMLEGKRPFDLCGGEEGIRCLRRGGRGAASSRTNSRPTATPRPCLRSGKTKPTSTPSWPSSRRNQGRRGRHQGSRQLQGSDHRGAQELRRLPPDLPQAGLVIARAPRSRGGRRQDAPPSSLLTPSAETESTAKKGVDAAQAPDPGGGPRRDRRRGILARHHAGHRASERARGAHARSRKRQDPVLRRRLRPLSCDAQSGGQDPARRRLGAEIVVRHLYAPNISPDRNDGIGGWSEANFVSAMWKGTARPRWRALLSASYTSYQRMLHGGPARPVRLSENAAAGAGKVRDHDLRIHFKIRRMLGGWKSLFDGQQFKPRPVQVGGTAAPISSTAPVIAPSATVRATSSARSSTASVSPAAPTRKAAMVGSPTSRKPASAITRSGTSSAFSRPATCPTAIPSAER